MSARISKKQKDLEKLKQLRDSIQAATEVSVLENEMATLEGKLKQMQKSSSGDELEVIKTTLKKIKAFWMYDETRREVIRWVQTLMCYLKE